MPAALPSLSLSVELIELLYDYGMAKVVCWDQPTRTGWRRFHHQVLAATQISGQRHQVSTRPAQVRGAIRSGFVVADGVEFPIRPGQSLVLDDPLEPDTWRVGY